MTFCPQIHHLAILIGWKWHIIQPISDRRLIERVFQYSSAHYSPFDVFRCVKHLFQFDDFFFSYTHTHHFTLLSSCHDLYAFWNWIHSIHLVYADVWRCTFSDPSTVHTHTCHRLEIEFLTFHLFAFATLFACVLFSWIVIKHLFSHNFDVTGNSCWQFYRQWHFARANISTTPNISSCIDHDFSFSFFHLSSFFFCTQFQWHMLVALSFFHLQETHKFRVNNVHIFMQ